MSMTTLKLVFVTYITKQTEPMCNPPLKRLSEITLLGPYLVVVMYIDTVARIGTSPPRNDAFSPIEEDPPFPIFCVEVSGRLRLQYIAAVAAIGTNRPRSRALGL